MPYASLHVQFYANTTILYEIFLRISRKLVNNLQACSKCGWMRGIHLKRSASNRIRSSLDVMILLLNTRCEMYTSRMWYVQPKRGKKKLKSENVMLSEHPSMLMWLPSPARNDILLIWLLTLYFEQRADYGWLANKNIIIYKWGVYLLLHWNLLQNWESDQFLKSILQGLTWLSSRIRGRHRNRPAASDCSAFAC